MNAIAKNTENNLDGLSVVVLSEMANNAAKNVETQMRTAVQNAIVAGRALIAAKSQVAHGEWLDWLRENWAFSQPMASKYMAIANYNHSYNLDSASSISEALRMIAEAKAEAKGNTEEQPELFGDDAHHVSLDDADDFICSTCKEAFATPVWHCESCDHHWPESVDLCRNCRAADADGLLSEDVGYEDDEDDVPEEDSIDEDIDLRTERPCEVEEFTRAYYTSEQWSQLDAIQRSELLSEQSDKKLNKQDTASIEWAQWSWNPITGCKHDCPYCYARDIANRFYQQKFEPSIYPARFACPENTNVPEQAKSDTAYKNVFAGSMADIWGRWVPAEWIELVLETVDRSPNWNFLFLTKFPQRVHEFGELPENAWMGTTVDCQDRVKNAEKAFSKMGGGIKWLSVEPMLTPLKFNSLELFDWVVIGGASRSAETPAWIPPLAWMIDLYNQAKDAGCAVYFKSNCGIDDEIRIKEFPWQAHSQTELPEQLKYLNIK